MDLIERVYQTEPNIEIWGISPFWYFNPSAGFLRSKIVKRAIEKNDSEYLINTIRNDFYPGKSNEETEEHMRNAINRGIVAINTLSIEHLGDDAQSFIIPEISAPLDPLASFKDARNKYVEARDGRHFPDRNDEMYFDAYNLVRAWGIGKIILTIDTSPEVLNSLRHGEGIKEWMGNNFGFREVRPSGIEDLPFVWKTNIDGVFTYGDRENPLRTRTKIIGRENNLKYGSIMMKMFNKKGFMDLVKDNYGIEFIVTDDNSRDKLVRYFKRSVKGGGHLEEFRSPGSKGHNKRGASSSEGFDVVKFILRPPIKVRDIPPYKNVFERNPVEIQILTLESHRERFNNPNQMHEAYKKRQFSRVFPLWFPKEIYAPLLSK